MAKQIKAIACPKCGSTDKSEPKPEYYKCSNCGTEYFLDNDDITINHRVLYPEKKPADSKKLQRLGIILLGSLFFLWFVMWLFPSRPAQVAYTPSHSRTWNSKNYDFILSAAGNPVVVIAGDKTDDSEAGQRRREAHVELYDLIAKKQIRSEKLPLSLDNNRRNDFNVRRLSDNQVYIIINKRYLYRVTSSLRVEEVATSLFSQHPRMSSGIANADFRRIDDGNPLKITANDGILYFYYPQADKLYNEEENREQTKLLARKEAGEQLQTVFQFSYDRSFEEKGQQLIRHTQKKALNGADKWPIFEWRKEQYNDPEPVMTSWFGKELIRSFDNFTPKRKYFNAKVLHFDEEVVLIHFTPTPAEDEEHLLQCLDAKTAEIKWTRASDMRWVSKVIRFKGGFALEQNSTPFVLDNKGKTISAYKIQ